jgi:hypothetical protein
MTGGGSSGDVTLNVIGTADKVTVSADAVTIASTYIGQTSITTLGTIGTGTWNGTAVAAAYGGTGQTSYTTGDLPYASGSTAISKLGIGTANKVLTSSGTAPQWSTQLVNAALPTNIDVGGTLDVTGDTTLDGDLVVSGAGPHAMGGAVNAANRLTLKGAFTGSGSSVSSALDLQGNLTGYAGCTSYLTKMQIQGQIITQTATESIGYISTLAIQEPNINDNLTGDITIAASLYIAGAPTEGETNAAIYVAAGESYFGDNVGFGTTPIANASSYTQTFFPLTSVICGIGGVDGNIAIQQNAYNHTGNNSFYAATDQASAYLMVNGVHYFRVAGIGTADTQITWTDALVVNNSGNVAISGALSKGSGSFRITHPLPALAETHELVHSFIEGPRADLIYRGTVILVAGTAVVDLDDAAGMTAGTWVLLCRDEQVFTSNETSYNHIRGSVSGSTLTIECEEATCTDSVSWMVVAERMDQHMLDTDWTDENGRPITEPLIPPPDPPDPEEDDDDDEPA